MTLLQSLALVAAAGCARIAAPVAAPVAADSVSARAIGRGVVHRRLVVNSTPWVLNIVEIDLRRRDLEVRTEHALGTLAGRERTSDLLRRVAGDSLEPIAAVNGDFFQLRSGEAIGNQVVEGRVLSASAAHPGRPLRSQFALSRDGRPLIERFALDGAVVIGTDTLLLAAVNAEAANALTLRLGRAPDTLVRDSTGEIRALVLVPVAGDSMQFRSDGVLRPASEARRPPGGALLVANGAAVGSLRTAIERARPPVTIMVRLALVPDRGSMRSLIGGWPRLVVDGVSVGDSTRWHEGAAASFITTRHPRSGVGFTRDSSALILVVVDGRQPRSAGMTIPEFAETMRALGAYQALNLDGGGSTTLVVRDSIVNSPSDAAGERTVGNALIVVRRK